MMRIAMLGSFPPQVQGIPDYCGPLASALSQYSEVTALGFKKMYPAFVFPGEKSSMDPAGQLPQGPHLTVHHSLTWYNPFGWLIWPLRARADVFHLQWWSLPLFPVALTVLLTMKLLGRPIVVTVHNVLPHEASPGFMTAGRIVCRLADRVIVHSGENQRQLVEGYGVDERRVVRIPEALPCRRPKPCRAVRLGPLLACHRIQTSC